MNMKRLSFRQVRWAQKLSKYHFRIDYRQDKANGAADAFIQYSQRSAKEEKILRAKNAKILHWLQSLLVRVLGLNVLGMSVLGRGEVSSSLHQVFICETAVLSQLRQFWDTIWSELADKGPYTVSIEGIRIRLLKLQDNNKNAKKLRLKGLSESWEDIEQILYYQDLPYVPKVIRSELISRHHDNLFVVYFNIEKTRELIARKYYWLTLQQDVKAYFKGCDVCLASKTVHHKPYRNLQLLPVPTHW